MSQALEISLARQGKISELSGDLPVNLTDYSQLSPEEEELLKKQCAAIVSSEIRPDSFNQFADNLIKLSGGEFKSSRTGTQFHIRRYVQGAYDYSAIIASGENKGWEQQIIFGHMKGEPLLPILHTDIPSGDPATELEFNLVGQELDNKATYLSTLLSGERLKRYCGDTYGIYLTSVILPIHTLPGSK